MNEVENHYAGQGGGSGAGSSGGTGAGSSGSGSAGSSAASAARSALDQATSTAKEGLKSAADTARSATDAARHTAEEAYSSASRTVSQAGRRSAQEFTRTRRGVEAFVEENPIMVGVVGLAAGLLVGALLPNTRRENQVFGRYADEVRDQGLRYARDLAQQGRQFVEENLDAATAATRGRSDRDTGDETRAM